MTITDDWYGLYRAGWKNMIVDDAFQHPAKFARNLIKQIYDHCLVCHWLEAGDTVVDPFGGVALGGLDAMRLGLNWIGVELEPKFVDLGNRNIALWNERYSDKFMRWGTACLLQGDSRRLLEVISGADGVVSSPPYAASMEKRGGIDPEKSNHVGGPHSQMNNSNTRYGQTAGQLAALREGDLDAAISSPPFGETQTGGGIIVNGYHNEEKRKGVFDLVGKRSYTPDNQGVTPGNLAALRADDDGFAAAVNADAVVSSPPYEGSDPSASHVQGYSRLDPSSPNYRPFAVRSIENGYNDSREYGSSPGQLAAESGDTFWSAARVIVAQTFAALRPGGHAVWVVKAFVRDGKRVEFPDQWRQLCESVGFVTLHVHRAWLVEDHGAQLAMDGNHKQNRKERKSFFRRLAESKGSPRIDYETIVCMEKPGA